MQTRRKGRVSRAAEIRLAAHALARRSAIWQIALQGVVAPGRSAFQRTFRTRRDFSKDGTPVAAGGQVEVERVEGIGFRHVRQLFPEQRFDQVVVSHAQVISHTAQDGVERAGTQIAMGRYGDMMFTLQIRRETQMASCLPGDAVTVPFEEKGKLEAADVSG